MDPLAGGVWVLALSVMGFAALYIFKGPKEVSSEHSKRLDELEDDHHKLDKAVEGLVVEVRHLALNVASLAQIIQRMSEARISGRHPRSPG
jgi:hypothetical protein